MDEETKQLIHQIARDVGTLQSDASSLKSDVSELKTDAKTLTLRSDVLEFNFDEMHADMDLGFSLTNDSFEKLTRHIDGFTAGLHRDDRLEERILRLERQALYGR